MKKFKIGQKCRHKRTGEILYIKKFYGNIVSCRLEKPQGFIYNNICIDSAVCDVENLEIIDESL